MPDLPGRLDLEETFAEALGKRGHRVARQVIDLMGDDSRALTFDEWNEIAQQFTEVIQPQLETVYQHGAGNFYDHLNIGRDEDVIGSYAQRWAHDHASSLSDGLIDNSRAHLDALRADLLEGRLSASDFRKRVYDLFGSARAEMIAATETTRAAVAAELQVVNTLRSYGLQYVAVWNTANDSLTCPICAPRHGVRRGEGWNDYPPAHPRCRCWVNHVPTDVEGVT